MKNLELDCFVYSIIKVLSDKQDEFCEMDSEANLCISYQNLVKYATALYGQLPNADLKPLINYVTHRLRDEHFYEAFILPEVFEALIGWKHVQVSSLNDRQLESQDQGRLMQISAAQMMNSYDKAEKGRQATKKIFMGKNKKFKEIGLSLLIEVASAATNIAN